jgi:hypothetical protein
MNILKILLILFFSILSNNYSFAGTTDPSVSDAKYVEYGAKFHCVVKVCGTDKNGVMFCASAVAIDANHILTAAHVVNECKTCVVTIKDKKYNISDVVIHKNFENSKFGVGDIAIGYSEESFNLDFYPSLYESDDELDKVCSISGYGLTGTFITGAVSFDDKKRAGSNIVHGSENDLLICDPSRRSSSKYTELEFLIASGDSGGGLFINGKLAGINSCVMSVKGSPNSKYGEESGHTRVSKFIGWINENKKKMD